MAMIAMTTSNSIRVKAELRAAGLTHWHFLAFILAGGQRCSGLGSQRLARTTFCPSMAYFFPVGGWGKLAWDLAAKSSKFFGTLRVRTT